MRLILYRLRRTFGVPAKEMRAALIAESEAWRKRDEGGPKQAAGILRWGVSDGGGSLLLRPRWERGRIGAFPARDKVNFVVRVSDVEVGSEVEVDAVPSWHLDVILTFIGLFLIIGPLVLLATGLAMGMEGTTRASLYVLGSGLLGAGLMIAAARDARPAIIALLDDVARKVAESGSDSQTPQRS